jgi:16S rRNA (guanine1207-N2)-methyltransferase
MIAGGRIKHMTLAMNEVLGRSFNEVNAGRARQNSPRSAFGTMPPSCGTR